MMRSAVLRIGSGAAVLALSAAAVLGLSGYMGAKAQDIPELPLVLYGSTSPSLEAGVGTLALVQSGGTWTLCGIGGVAEDGGEHGYAVQVLHESHRQGCGAAGRNISLYFTPVPEGEPYNGTGGRFASTPIVWSDLSTSPREQNVSLDSELQVRGVVGAIAVKVE